MKSLTEKTREALLIVGILILIVAVTWIALLYMGYTILSLGSVGLFYVTLGVALSVSGILLVIKRGSVTVPVGIAVMVGGVILLVEGLLSLGIS